MQLLFLFPINHRFVIISAIIGNLIIVNGTRRSILPDKGRNFKFSEFVLI